MVAIENNPHTALRNLLFNERNSTVTFFSFTTPSARPKPVIERRACAAVTVNA